MSKNVAPILAESNSASHSEPVRIYVGGNIYGAGNIGDDAVLHGIVQVLCIACPAAILTVGTPGGKNLDGFALSPGFVDIQNWYELGAAIGSCDCFVSGGGTLIGDELNLGFPLGYNNHLISRAKCYGKTVAMLGIGANTLGHAQSEKVARRILSLCDLVTVRDARSREVCLGLGADPNHTVTTADPAFLLQPTETDRTRRVKDSLRQKGRLFGINVVNEAWSDLGEYKRAIARAVGQLAAKYHCTPVFFCNEIRQGAAYDMEANRATAALLHCDHEILDPVYYCPGEMIDIISTFEFVLAMRMHALIFAAVAGVPFVGVSRVDKVDNFMHQFGLQSSGSVSSCDSSLIVADMKKLLDDRDAHLRHVAAQVDRLRQQCLQNIDLIRGLLTQRKNLWQKTNTLAVRAALYGERALAKIERSLRKTPVV